VAVVVGELAQGPEMFRFEPFLQFVRGSH
jgi:hypothetical protein